MVAEVLFCWLLVSILCLCVRSSFKSLVSMLVVVVMERYGVCDVVLLAGLICYHGDGF